MVEVAVEVTFFDMYKSLCEDRTNRVREEKKSKSKQMLKLKIELFILIKSSAIPILMCVFQFQKHPHWLFTMKRRMFWGSKQWEKKVEIEKIIKTMLGDI